MSRTNTITCDRCRAEAPMGGAAYAANVLPTGWSQFSYTPRGSSTVTTAYDLCPACLAGLNEVERAFDSRRLAYVVGTSVEDALAGRIPEVDRG